MIQTLLFIAGLAALTFGAELLVRGASRLALSFGLSPLVVGLTIVAFGTSAPEIAVAIDAAWSGQSDLTIGNVVGSNICNILLILGLGSLVAPLSVAGQVVRQEVPAMILASVIVIALAFNGAIGRIEGGVLFALLIGYLVFVVRQSRRASKREQSHYGEEMPASRWDHHWAVQVALVFAGLALLVIGAGWLVDAAVAFALWLGVDELVVGLTVVAIGTSLPEIATSVLAAWRGERDIAVGNAVGSNIFNLLGCLGLGAMFSPEGLPIARAALDFDLWVMLAVAVACLPIFLARKRIARWEGVVFLAYYAAYLIYLVLDSTGSGMLKTFGLAMVGFVLPLSLLTLVALTVRERRKPSRG